LDRRSLAPHAVPAARVTGPGLTHWLNLTLQPRSGTDRSWPGACSPLRAGEGAGG
jgi:hypothetical protein